MVKKLPEHVPPVTGALASERAAVGEMRKPARNHTAQPRPDPLLTGAERLRAVASAGAGASPPRLASSVRNALDFLVHETIPRLVAEREILYPVLDRALSRPEARSGLEVVQAEIP